MHGSEGKYVNIRNLLTHDEFSGLDDSALQKLFDSYIPNWDRDHGGDTTDLRRSILNVYEVNGSPADDRKIARERNGDTSASTLDALDTALENEDVSRLLFAMNGTGSTSVDVSTKEMKWLSAYWRGKPVIFFGNRSCIWFTLDPLPTTIMFNVFVGDNANTFMNEVVEQRNVKIVSNDFNAKLTALFAELTGANAVDAFNSGGGDRDGEIKSNSGESEYGSDDAEVESESNADTNLNTGRLDPSFNREESEKDELDAHLFRQS